MSLTTPALVKKAGDEKEAQLVFIYGRETSGDPFLVNQPGGLLLPKEPAIITAESLAVFFFFGWSESPAAKHRLELDMDTRLQPGTVSQLLADIHAGDAGAKEQLGQLLAAELEIVADRFMHRERPGHTLQPGDLVQEVFLRLLEGDVLDKAQNRAYLFGAASTAMRRVLVEYARKRAATKHGGNHERIPMLDEALDHYSATHFDLIALHDALETLKTLNPRQCQIVDEYHFGGFTLREIGEHLEVSEATVSIDLKRAQLWLATRLDGESP